MDLMKKETQEMLHKEIETLNKEYKNGDIDYLTWSKKEYSLYKQLAELDGIIEPDEEELVH